MKPTANQVLLDITCLSDGAKDCCHSQVMFCEGKHFDGKDQNSKPLEIRQELGK